MPQGACCLLHVVGLRPLQKAVSAPPVTTALGEFAGVVIGAMMRYYGSSRPDVFAADVAHGASLWIRAFEPPALFENGHLPDEPRVGAQHFDGIWRLLLRRG